MRRALAVSVAFFVLACGKSATSDAGLPPVGGGFGGGFTGTGGGMGGGGGSSDAGATGCAAAADFTTCTAPDASTAFCVSRECVAVPSCDGGNCLVSGPSFRLPDTNLRQCFGPSPNMMDGTIACPDTPGAASCATTDYCGEDAQYGWDTQHDASTRFTVQTPNGERVVTDTVTGLVWQGCAMGQSGDTCTGGATLGNWFDAVATCESATWGGFDDWVLPDSFELMTLNDYGRTSPAIDTSAFVNAPSRFAADYDQWWIECTWSSSEYARDPSVAWVAMVNSGDLSEGSGLMYHLNDKAAATWPGCYTRCVRARTVKPKLPRFVRHEAVAGEPVVADTVTRLTWQGCSHGQTGSACAGTAAFLDWKSALAACEGLVSGGRDDWRLPNILELRSLARLDRESPAIDVDAFPNTPHYGVGMTEQNAGQFWSSTGRSYNDFALYADFGTGFTHFYVQPEGRHVRCVRDP